MTIRSKRLALFASLILFLVADESLSQCSLVDTDRGSVYLTYEKLDAVQKEIRKNP